MADKCVLVAGQDAIRVGHIPQHLDYVNTFLLVEVRDDNSGKVMEIGRFDRTLSRRRAGPQPTTPRPADTLAWPIDRAEILNKIA
jgi:hypothetical protein